MAKIEERSGLPDGKSNWKVKDWIPFAIISAFFFHITASTFTSLGVVLPHMIAELDWSWSEAGAGFSLLALMVGLAAMAPAWVIRVWNIRATFGIGGAIMIIGFWLLATTHGLIQYFIGAGLAGLGYTLCATVPAVYYFNRTVRPKGRSATIGAYMTIGGLGGVAGPLMVTSIVDVTESWRAHWWIMCLITVILTLLSIFFIKDRVYADESRGEENNTATSSASTGEKSAPPAQEWAYKDIIKTRQFQIIVAAMTLTLFCGLTVNSWAVTHMVELGVPAAVAATALSGHALANALSRGVGGLLGERIDPKWLLVAALAAEVFGMSILAIADNPVTIVIFAIAEGFGFGMCLLATTLLLVKYFGSAKIPEILGSMHLVTTLAMLGPVLAGSVAERTGGFGLVFVGYAVIVLIVLVAAIFMRPPILKGAE